MAQNYIQPGDQAITIIAPTGGTTVGLPVLMSAAVGKLVIANKTALAGAVLEGFTEGVYELPKEAPLVINQFEPVYWDNTAKKVTKTTSGNILLGHAAYGAISAAVLVQVRLAP